MTTHCDVVPSFASCAHCHIQEKVYTPPPPGKGKNAKPTPTTASADEGVVGEPNGDAKSLSLDAASALASGLASTPDSGSAVATASAVMESPSS